MAPDGVCICGRTDPPGLADVLEAKWPGDAPRLPWFLDPSGYRGGLSVAQLAAAFAEAWGYWAAVVDITPVQVATAAEAKVRVRFAPIDGPSQVLAWSELANDTDAPKQQQYDSGDNWIVAEQPVNGVDLVRVACHEIGHVLGLTHDAPTAAALLAPTYSTAIRRPTERDVSRLLALGYRRRAAPPPPTPPAVGAIALAVDPAARVVTIPAGWTARVA